MGDPIDVDDWTWYYEGRKTIHVFHQGPGEEYVSFFLPAKTLAASLRRMAAAERRRETKANGGGRVRKPVRSRRPAPKGSREERS